MCSHDLHDPETCTEGDEEQMTEYPTLEEFIGQAATFGRTPDVRVKDGRYFLAVEPLFGIPAMNDWVLEAMKCNQARTKINLQMDREDMIWLRDRIDFLLNE